ncbi:lipoprotein-anchoring transpeptidase ErfK/SrfK [Herbihabitans rhizosphaerae]|uniref:Lipoprotein-anchoring transpeptidase ErfK/SrfK n=1 Tax=Herbihabitans rhizosphaerae TaxID=1872711 RepID=A0A4Q7L4P3_9PSEU|nr:Ig-like domain-containing protein [Herbihabitans rhizosphaerae]RZS44599.1 lipoprotein-anchoring transpeptidase ErfK/SrfK [Herbihabitans rhizosphaerae]
MRGTRVQVRFRVLGALIALLGVFVLAGCTGDGDGGGGGTSGSGDKTPDAPPKAKILAEPLLDAKEVPVTAPVKLTVVEGTLTEATLANSEGKPVAGAIAPDKLSWTNTEVLGFGKTYTYTAKATGTDNKTVELRGSFTTMNPAKQIRATLNPGDNATVGVGMPVSVKFDTPVASKAAKAAVERALLVQTSVPVEGSWGWLHDRQVDWRPKDYWPANTKVTVNAKLYGLDYGNGAYGRADVSTKFTIGRNQVVKLHTPSHQMVVQRGGATVATYPASFGKDHDPNLNTPNGTMIVMAKAPTERFDNARYGYVNVWKKWAVRFSNHGEFIHENEENRGNIGKVNTSHGCANLLEPDAKAYFDSAMVGDPVEVTGSQATMPRSSDVNDWLFPWPQWQSMSALR